MSRSTLTKIGFALSLIITSLGAMSQAQAGGAYGPDTCKVGYVWREAYPGDHTCVTPEQRARAALDNRQAGNRVSATDRTYGSRTCRQGYVWREAYVGDTTCVTPEQRARVKYDNARANGRYQ